MATTSPHLLQLPVRSPEFRVLIAGGYAIFRSRLELPISRVNYASPSLRARKVRVECVAKSSHHEETELVQALVKDGDDNDDEVVVAHGNSVPVVSSQEFPISRMNYASPSLRARNVRVECVAKSSHEETELEQALAQDGDDNDDEVREDDDKVVVAHGNSVHVVSCQEFPISRMNQDPSLRARNVRVKCVTKSSHEETELVQALAEDGDDNDDEVREDDDKVVVAHGNSVHVVSCQEFPISRMNHDPSRRARNVRVKCVAKSSHEETELVQALVEDGDDNDDEVREDDDVDKVVVAHGNSVDVVSSQEFSNGSASSQRNVSASSGDLLSIGIREPVYEVVEVKTCGTVAKRKINRRHLLKSSGLRPRDIRSVDPSLWLTNSMPALLVREHAILLNLGSLRAIVMQERVLIFNYNRKGGKAFIDSLLPRLNPTSTNGGPSMPFVLEVVEAALHSRIQRLEHRLWDLEPRVQALLEVLPNRLTGDILEELRISKQKLVELGSRAGALKQMLLDILEDTHEIRHICIIGRNCVLKKENDEIECSVPLDKEIAEEEEEEIEMLLENYLQRCESCHGQAERLLDSAKEMEDSIAVNLSSRRLEVSRFELILQVGTFCVAVGALVAGIFGMNLRSYLEEHVFAFWLTTAGIIVGAVLAFYLMYWYLRTRKIL